ncbi:hypothetical protein ABBQ38_014983 [Trebouxia sp. C0009 RCD-2024]
MAELVKDHLHKLRRTCSGSELASQLRVPYDLLDACNPGELAHLTKGQTISLGGQYKVQKGDTIWTVSKALTSPGNPIKAYDLVKYNYGKDTQNLLPGSILIVPTRRRVKTD